MRIWTTTRTTIIALTLAFVAVAGDTDSPAAPSNPASAMYHLEDIYNRLDTGAAGAKRAGAFEEPTAGDFAAGAPGDSGPTLDDVMGGRSRGERQRRHGRRCAQRQGLLGPRRGRLGTADRYGASRQWRERGGGGEDGADDVVRNGGRRRPGDRGGLAEPALHRQQ